MSVDTALADGVLTLTFDRPAAFNAMTFDMYAALHDACERADATEGVQVVVLRGAGGKAFVAGTDIPELLQHVARYGGGSYEQRVEAVMARLEAVKVPVVAAVDGVAAGAGLLFVAIADLCICTEDSRFGAPIARTLGNCLSVRNTARLVRQVGERAVKDLLFTARMIGAAEAQRLGLVNEVAPRADFEQRLAALTRGIALNAPLSLRALKEALRRLPQQAYPDDADLIEGCYGSNDFREGAQAFQQKRKAVWSGS